MNQSEKAAAASWGAEQMLERWQDCLEEMIAQNVVNFPLQRLQFQATQDPGYQRIVQGWSDMSGEERVEAWEELLQVSQRTAGEILPVCVSCGRCCEKGSPALHMDDLELVRTQAIPWSKLVTLRRGEPVRSPLLHRPYSLEEERIKLREVGNACGFYDANEKVCQLYADRPVQCRAQACWDESLSEELFKEPPLTRRALLEEVPALWAIIDEHERRCAFDSLQQSLEATGKGDPAAAETALAALAFDAHVREFVVERGLVPADVLELLFGRPLSALVELFGLRVETATDGTRTLSLDPDAALDSAPA